MENSIAYDHFIKKRTRQSLATAKHLKNCVWLYFLLLIFEGALRKWFLPSLSNPLLIVRDPIALWVVLVAISRGFLKPNIYIISIFLLSVISFYTAITLGHGNVTVGLFGLRILAIQFPFLFAIGAIFSREDVEKLGKITLWISLPMVVLIGLQFYSPQSAWVNRGVGGDLSGAGFSGALGFYRPPGTFSFTNGTALFFGFDSIFICYFLLNTERINRILLIAASTALVVSVPLSISRSLSFTIAVSVFFMLFALSTKPQYTGRVVGGIIGITILFMIISNFSFFQTASMAFTERFTTANESEGGLNGVLIDRYLGGLVNAIINSYQIPFFGFGLGMGTNAGAQILTGNANFLISEGEWGRLIGEMGLLFGLIVILIRIILSLEFAIMAFKRLQRNDILPWMILGFTLLSVPQGQWAQPTSLGFSILTGGLLLASLRTTTNK